MIYHLIPAFIIFALIGLLVFGWFKRVYLKGEIRRLTDLLSMSEKKADQMTEIARKAIEAAAEKHFPAPRVSSSERFDNKIEGNTFGSQSTYKPPQVTNCSQCGVSVRSDVWPISCPSCSTPIDIEEWPDTLTGLPDRE